MTTTQPFARVADLIWRRIGEDVVVISADGRSTHILNKTAALIWEACDGGSGAADVTAALCQRFDVSPEEAGQDVRETIEKMTQLGILEQATETAID